MVRPATLLTALLWLTTPAPPQRFEPRPTAELQWFKGNTHSHTTESDGSSGMEEIWDGLLSVGKRTHGIAVDDARVENSGGFQAWIQPAFVVRP